MSSRSAASFFDYKRPWSQYKDRILEYYLKPYLEKVKQLDRPIAVFDMFAGRGRFETGEPGSPLIIADRLAPHHGHGVPVRLTCYEENRAHYGVLKREIDTHAFAVAHQCNCFDRIEDIASVANTHTTFLYVDPCDVVQLKLERLGLVYAKLRARSSVEVLLVFMARAFLRQARQIIALEKGAVAALLADPLIRDAAPEDQGMWAYAMYSAQEAWPLEYVRDARRELTEVAGGTYWEGIVSDDRLSYADKLGALTGAYARVMSRWFPVVLQYPIYADEGDPIPKYWLVFGTRHPPATDLFNDAACHVSRMQGVAYRTEDSLFKDVKVDTSADERTVVAAVRSRMRSAGKSRWDQLRWGIERESVGRFKRSEIDRAIKQLIGRREILGATGETNEDEAVLNWFRPIQ